MTNTHFGPMVVESQIRELYFKAFRYPPRPAWWRKWERMSVQTKQQVWDNLLQKLAE